MPVDGTGTASVETVKAFAGPGRAKTSSLGLKTVVGPSRGGGAEGEGEETSGSENKTCLARARQSAAATRLGVRDHTGLEVAYGDDLIQGPNSDGKGAGSATQNGIGAVVERLERWNDAATTDPDKGGTEHCWQLGARIVPRQRKSGNIQSFRTILNNRINRNFFTLQKFIRQHNRSAKNCLSQGKTSVFPQLCAESEEFKG